MTSAQDKQRTWVRICQTTTRILSFWNGTARTRRPQKFSAATLLADRAGVTAEPPELPVTAFEPPVSLFLSCGDDEGGERCRLLPPLLYILMLL